MDQIAFKRAATLALAAMCFGVGAQASITLEYDRTFTLPRGESGRSLPVAVTSSANGEICVTEGRESCGYLFTDRTVPVFKTGAASGLSDPMDLTPEDSGGFVCTDSKLGGGRTIRRLNLYGEPTPYEPEAPVQDWRPEHLLVTRDGNYVTTDPSSGLLAKHDSRTGSLLWKLDLTEGSGELLGLGKPAEAGDGRLYLPIGGDHIIRILSSEGDPETSFGRPGTSRGRLAFPVGVAFSPDGSIAVLDRMRHTVLLYDTGLEFRGEFGEYGIDPRNLYYPASITATPDGRVYVAQGFLGRIVMFRFVSTSAACASTASSRPLMADGRGR